MPRIGRIPAWIYVELDDLGAAGAFVDRPVSMNPLGPETSPDERARLLTKLATEIDVLDITDADVALFAESDGRIRPDWTQPMEELTSEGFVAIGIVPLGGRHYDVTLQVTRSPARPHATDQEAHLADSGVIGTHHYGVFADNRLDASYRAVSAFTRDWQHLPAFASALLCDVEEVAEHVRNARASDAPKGASAAADDRTPDVPHAPERALEQQERDLHHEHARLRLLPNE